jgi:2-polyprenyl-6-methoxyphenol hydroxylase-like FAD-dependent oxidoreductase
LYESLPDKSRIKTGVGVTDIKHVPSGVEVTLSNGEIEKGDMVLGCDGTYSTAKSMMWEHANKLTPGRITVKEKTSELHLHFGIQWFLSWYVTSLIINLYVSAYRTDWKAVVGVAPPVDGLGQRDMTSVSSKGHTFISFSQPDRIYFFFIFAVKEPYTWPRRPNPADEDAEALAESVADHPISETTVFGELWKKRYRGQLIYLEDGVLNHWHAGRIVLAGDAVHKVWLFASILLPSVTDPWKQFTPNMGFGGNCGIESIAVLCNSLNRLLLDSNGRKPSAAALDGIFHAYQEQRIPRVKEINELCRLVTKVQAWHSPLHKFMDRWYFPLQSDKSIANLISEIIRNGEKLDYVDVAGFPKGTMTWKDDEKAIASTGAFLSTQLVRLVGAVAALLVVLQGVRLVQLASATPHV